MNISELIERLQQWHPTMEVRLSVEFARRQPWGNTEEIIVEDVPIFDVAASHCAVLTIQGVQQ